jgi:hypothetical protein
MLQAFPKVFLASVFTLTAALAFAQQANTNATVKYPSAFAISQPLSELQIDTVGVAEQEKEAPRPMPVPLRSRVRAASAAADSVLQKEVMPFVSAAKGAAFDAIAAKNYAPSDVNLAVGPNYIVQTVNVRLAVYSKSGALLSGPTNFTTLFGPLGGNCKAGASDPIVNYDRLADRWVLSDIGISTNYTFSECVAVSKTNNPTGAYTLYSYSFGTNLNDYPKLSVWPTTTNSAYLATYNIFQQALFFGGADICGFDRKKMLAGDKTA